MAAFGPNLSFSSVPAPRLEMKDVLVRAKDMIDKYKAVNVGYVENRGRKNKKKNFSLKLKFDNNPRSSFWLEDALTSSLDPALKEFAIFVFSVISSSAAPERSFSIMKHMISARRSRYTGDNTDMRLTTKSLLPAKRKLENLLEQRQIKKNKLFHSPLLG